MVDSIDCSESNLLLDEKIVRPEIACWSYRGHAGCLSCTSCWATMTCVLIGQILTEKEAAGDQMPRW